MIINGKLIEVAGKMRLRGDDAFNPRNMDRCNVFTRWKNERIMQKMDIEYISLR